MFNNLRLPVEDATEATAEVLIELIGRTGLLVEILIEILAEIFEVEVSLVVYCLGFSVS